MDTVQVTAQQKSHIENLQTLTEQYPGVMELQYNLGNALSEIGVPTGAISAYQNALSLEDTNQRSQAFYNLGNAFFEVTQQLSQRQSNLSEESTQDIAKKSQQALEGSLHAFTQAMMLNPGDNDARWNYELVKRMLEQNEQQQSQHNQDGEKNEKQDSQEQDSEKSENHDQEQQQSQTEQSQEKQAENQPQPEKQEKMTKDEAERLLQVMEQKENEQKKEMIQKRIQSGTPGKDW